MTYPNILGEIETLRFVAAGASLARYGDGEFALCAGHPIKCERGDLTLSRRLREILRVQSGPCLVGIPNIWSETPKIGYWRKYATQAAPFLNDTGYVSSFVSRPDSAPWIDTPEYWSLLESLWRDQDVSLVRGGGRSFTSADLTSARSVEEIIAPSLHAWRDYDELLEAVGTPTRALLCVGPTATVMAYDLAARGVHAIDLGHAGMFWRKHLAGEPMIRTEADKVAV